MKNYILPALLLVACAALAAAAVLTDGAIPGGATGLLFALCGVSGGMGVSGIAMTLSDRRRTPEERRELERAEHDERNIAIREKAAMSSWYWTLYLLWAVFMVCAVTAGGVTLALVSVVIVLHCSFYLINISRWAKKM